MLAVALALLAPTSAPPTAAATAAEAAPGGPGALSHFDLARKDCLGTARNSRSKVWYTVAGGVLSDVYSPTIDNTNVETLQYVVTDGQTFTDLQSRDMTYTVRSTDESGMACRVTSTAKSGKYRLVTDYVTDPDRDAVVASTRLEPAKGTQDLKVYVRYDATINGNGGGGSSNGGADDAVVDAATTALVSSDPDTETNAANRDYAVPLYGALRADRPFLEASSGYAGTASDGLAQLDADHSAGHDVRRGARRQRRADGAGRRREGRAVHARARLRHDEGPGDRRRRQVRARTLRQDEDGSTRRPGAATTRA